MQKLVLFVLFSKIGNYSINELTKKLKIKNKYLNLDAISNSLLITKILRFVGYKPPSNFLLFLQLYLEKLPKSRYNYITLLLLLNFIDKKFINKMSKQKIYWFYKILYMLSIGEIIYKWSYVDKCNSIPKSFKNFLDNGCGLSETKIQTFRNEMTINGWVLKETSNPNKKICPLNLESLPKCLINVSKVVFFNEILKLVIKKFIFKRPIKFKIHDKFKNIIFLTSVFQLPILLVSIYNYFNIKKPSKNLIKLWALLSGSPIFLANNFQTKIVVFFLLATYLNRKLVNNYIGIPNSILLNLSLKTLISDSLKNKLEKYINNLIKI